MRNAVGSSRRRLDDLFLVFYSLFVLFKEDFSLLTLKSCLFFFFVMKVDTNLVKTIKNKDVIFEKKKLRFYLKSLPHTHSRTLFPFFFLIVCITEKDICTLPPPPMNRGEHALVHSLCCYCCLCMLLQFLKGPCNTFGTA